MTKQSSPRAQPVKPSQLKVGNIIIHNGRQAEVIKIRSWNDAAHGTVYGLDLEIRGKNARGSYTESGTVDLLD